MDEKQRDILLAALSEAPAEHQEVTALVDLQEERYTRVSVDSEGITALPEAEGNRITFIDGGNSELIRAPHLSLQLVRLAAVTYRGTEREETVREEFFVLIKSATGKTLEYEARILRKGGNEETLRFNPSDRRLTTGIKRAEPSLIGGVVRRLSEVNLAARIAHKLSKGDAIVLDGTLEATYPGESEALAETTKSASQHGIVLAGLAKRCSLLTTAGNPLLTVISGIAKGGTWQCEFAKGTSRDHDARLYAVRLNSRARHIFRLDIANGADESCVDALLTNLARHSREATFPGYPYGLIEADKMARVSNQEQRYHLALLEARLGKGWKKMSEAMSSMNAHDILDSM